MQPQKQSKKPAHELAKRHAPRIFEIRGQRGILDSDLATLYGVAVKHLNQQVKRNETGFRPISCCNLQPKKPNL